MGKRIPEKRSRKQGSKSTAANMLYEGTIGYPICGYIISRLNVWVRAKVCGDGENLIVALPTCTSMKAKREIDALY